MKISGKEKSENGIILITDNINEINCELVIDELSHWEIETEWGERTTSDFFVYSFEKSLVVLRNTIQDKLDIIWDIN